MWKIESSPHGLILNLILNINFKPNLPLAKMLTLGKTDASIVLLSLNRIFQDRRSPKNQTLQAG